jgi:flagellar hook-associated protein 1 FlgK
MSFFAFNLIGNALDSFQEAQNITSDNISNVSTTGASRQEADIVQGVPIAGSPFLPDSGGSPGTQGEGAVVKQITRIHQDSYDGLYRGASSSQYFYTEEQSQLSTLQGNFGEPSNGVNSAFSSLQTAIASAANQTGASASTQAYRQSVLQAATTFATALNTASTAISNQESSVVTQGTSLVQQANTLINQIATLNGQIRSLTVAGTNPNTYLDERDNAIDQLAQLLPTSTALQPNGSALVTVNGRALVNDTEAYDLAPPVIGTASDGTASLVVGFANDPDPDNPTPIPLGSGQLGALTDLYNNKLVPYGQQLDKFASSTADEINRVTQAGVDGNGNDGSPLFEKAAGSTSITAASITVAISQNDPNELALGVISTAAGSLTANMASANNTVTTADAIDGNTDLYNPGPAGGLTGTLNIAVDGTTQTFSYNTGAGGNSSTIADFMTNFNAGHYGVTASFDATAQQIVFTRDPNNTDAVHRALQGANATTPEFTITDSNPTGSPATQGYPAGSLLQALGASSLSGVPQTALNAFGQSNNGAANALTTLFSTQVGIGALQTTASAVSSATAGSVTITQPAGAPGAFSTVDVGQVLTIVHDAGQVGQTEQTVAVTAVDRLNGTITVNATDPVAVGDAISTTPQQTLGAAYQSLVTQMGLDVQTAATGVSTQTTLASSINASRQSVDGINIDEETQNLLMYQNAYSAAAKTLETLNTMMQTTLGLIGGSS